MPKPEERIKNGPTAVSDYPDLISDTDVVFGNAHIIPHVIDKVLDKAEISVTFGDKNVENGVKLSLDDIANEPDLRISKADGAHTYTLVLVDPDAPSPVTPKYR